MKITNIIQNYEINKEKQHQAELHCYWAGPIISAAHHSARPTPDSCSRTRPLTERPPSQRDKEQGGDGDGRAHRRWFGRRNRDHRHAHHMILNRMRCYGDPRGGWRVLTAGQGGRRRSGGSAPAIARTQRLV
jgi:hypothetical protein